MGRKPKPLDLDAMLAMIEDGAAVSDIAEVFNVSVPTINARIEKLKKAESALLAYDKNHYLDLIAVKQRLMAGITDEKIEDAPLQHIAGAYGVFSKMEQLIQGRPTEIHGLMGYLMHLEKEREAEILNAMNVVEAEEVTKKVTESVTQLELDF
jgi:DNA-binding Lrp family transcriptional regulator